MKIFQLVFAAAAVCLFSVAAEAACTAPFPVINGNGGSNTTAAIADASSNCLFGSAIKDGSGTNNSAAVKAGAASPVASDPALVVGVSPNSLGCAGASVANTKSTPISITTGTQILLGVASTQIYVCSLNLVIGAADNVALVEGTGTVCATGVTGMSGGATAATGWNFAANGGLTLGNGVGIVTRTATAADNVCLLVSGAAQVSGNIVWAQF